MSFEASDIGPFAGSLTYGGRYDVLAFYGESRYGLVYSGSFRLY